MTGIRAAAFASLCLAGALVSAAPAAPVPVIEWPGGDATSAARQRLLADGEARLAAGDTVAAERAFDAAASMRHAPDAELGLLRAYLQAGDYRRAVGFAAHVAGAHRDTPAAAAQYVWLLQLGGQGATAKALLDAALAAAPADAALLRVLALMSPPAAAADASGVVGGGARAVTGPAAEPAAAIGAADTTALATAATGSTTAATGSTTGAMASATAATGSATGATASATGATASANAVSAGTAADMGAGAGAGAGAALALLLAPAERGPSAVDPAARVVGSGVLADAGRFAWVPAPSVEGARGVWLRNGLGDAVAARVERIDAAGGIALLRLQAPLREPDGWQASPREPFAGSPAMLVEYPRSGSSKPAWPWLRAGFFGRLPVAAAAARPLGIDVSPGPHGGPVFDAAGRLAGMAASAADGSAVLVPVASLLGLLPRGDLGNAGSAAVAPTTEVAPAAAGSIGAASASASPAVGAPVGAASAVVAPAGVPSAGAAPAGAAPAGAASPRPASAVSSDTAPPRPIGAELVYERGLRVALQLLVVR